jgi:hypothetical protein
MSSCSGPVPRCVHPLSLQRHLASASQGELDHWQDVDHRLVPVCGGGNLDVELDFVLVWQHLGAREVQQNLR